ncbi:hypothetical protein LSS_20436 [Leptospira santarosai serovar Shermani str. LT 821]|uniref:Uncharacterized protein n=1 Tax=Leptospira santarosai serovar Shermani str. LT 821 TaxID=758847 RepID=K8Y511_9LEPT|nr:hypothetical protein LSS_20436 [Leptospira santarosai serovar Shermani str. LT 821]
MFFVLKNIAARINWSDFDAYKQIRKTIIHSNGILKNPNSSLNYTKKIIFFGREESNNHSCN